MHNEYSDGAVRGVGTDRVGGVGRGAGVGWVSQGWISRGDKADTGTGAGIGTGPGPAGGSGQGEPGLGEPAQGTPAPGTGGQGEPAPGAVSASGGMPARGRGAGGRGGGAGGGGGGPAARRSPRGSIARDVPDPGLGTGPVWESRQQSTGTDRITDAEHESLALAAAFGPAPDADVHAAALAGAGRVRWLAAVALGGQGRYAAAAAVLRPLINGRDQVLAALAGATLASHRRQLGGHAAARRLDAAALARLAALGTPPVPTAGSPPTPTTGPRPVRTPGFSPDPYDTDLGGAWSDVLLGLAADAIGVGQLSQARRLHAAARALIDEGRVGGWRAKVRTGWVGAEIELAAGRPEAGRAGAEHAARLAGEVGARRHIVKSDLVLATTFAAGGTPEGAVRAHGLLEGVLSASLRWGIFSLAWPAALVLADLAPDRGEHFAKIASKALSWSFARADGEMQRLATASPWIPSALVRSGEPTRTGAG
jgi:hypothetical protein